MNWKNRFLTRREMLQQSGMGMGAVALTALLGKTGHLQAAPTGGAINPMAPKAAPLPAKAKRVVHLFMNGGPSHVDTFDPKPSLTRYGGKPIPITLKTERRTGAAFPTPFQFHRYGQSGIEVSEIFSNVGKQADELCVVRSMCSDIPNHEPSLMMMNCGEVRQVRPSFGSWVTYGLGSENENLPGFIVLCPDGLPTQGTQNWRSAFLPGAYQGTRIDTRETRIEKLIENIQNRYSTREEQRRQLDLLSELNRDYQQRRQEDSLLESRMQSFELAFRMQMEADEAFDLSKEPESVKKMYGEGLQARQMMIARRLLERGVRCVQVWHGAGQPWDSHDDIKGNHGRLARECDQPIAALLMDLKQRGMLEDTLVIWGGEFGRTPTVELPDVGANSGMVNGRDHNPYGFSMWVAGAGMKRGYAHGATDEFGFAAAEQKVHVHDLHATLLQRLGFDHEKFTYRYAGRDFRLTDVHGKVVRELLA
ncbi:MAG TPA: DUF1501 domain-containing protein [Bryobacteraceae bacterium]|nr:DUF1501 domain-containing protein [Bryobacteraceae bacterium]